MYEIPEQKPQGMFIFRLSNREAMTSVRKVAVRAGQILRDKRKYTRKAKYRKGYEA